MTVKQTLAEIRSMGLAVTRTLYLEFRVNYRAEDGGTEDTAYYTDDPQDAVDTARNMAGF